jgi:hypothetical protein
MQFDWKAFTTLDRVIAGGGLVAFIAAFLPWYGATVGPFSATVSGWSAGFSAWAGALLLTVAGVLVVLRRSGANLSGGPVDPSLLVAIVAAVGLLLVVVRWLSFPQYHAGGGLSYDVGARYGIFIALIAGIAQVTAAIVARRSAGEHAPSARAEPEPSPPEPAPEAPVAPEE